jgi:hypothetical protein
MQASTHLQSSENAFLSAGLEEDAKRVRIAKAKAIGQSREEMGSFECTSEVKKTDVDELIGNLMQDRPSDTLASIANEFVWRIPALEETVRETADSNPIFAMIPIQVMADDHVAASIGGIDDDIDGRIYQYVGFSIHTDALFLRETLRAAIEVHELDASWIAGFVARSNLFPDVTFVNEG